MSFEVLTATIARALECESHTAVEFIWHGGEPTVLPISFYEKAVYVQSMLKRPGQVVRNSLQTNGTRIDDRWARFFRDNEFEVSVSLDGPPVVHDQVRRYASGKTSWSDVRSGLDTLREYDMTASVLMVIDRDALSIGPEAIFEFFAEAQIDNYGLLAAKPTNVPDAAANTPADHYVTPAEMNVFLADYFDIWLAHGDPDIHVREFDGILRRLGGQRPTLCTLAGNCLGRYYLIEPNGDVAHCDLFVGDDRYTLGNVLTDTFAHLRAGETIQGLRRGNDDALVRMQHCPDFEICSGWCPHERYLAARHDPAYDEECCGLRDLISHIRSRVPSLLQHV